MKTALITTHIDVPNYGANLQAYTTKLFLEKNGIKPTYALLKPDLLEEKYRKSISIKQLKLHNEFVNKNFNVTPEFSDPISFYNYTKENRFDYNITGSDAVFRLVNNQSKDRWDLHYPNPFWLDFDAQNKISLSASAMGSNIPKLLNHNERDHFKCNLNTFKKILVRDDWTYRCLQRLGIDSDKCLDPVFLLRNFRSKPDKIHTGIKNPDYVVLSLPHQLPQSFEIELTALFEREGLGVINIGTPERELISGLDPFMWYDLIAGSKGYVGVRFHPIVVSISNQVPVFCLDMYARHHLERKKSKSYLLLKEFGLHKGYADRLTQKLITPKSIVKYISTQKIAEDTLLETKTSKTLKLYSECFN
ncbi:polysaccharide pyruvyl transferase family protein [Amylibacter sp.]|nr:polysaccharide pyruvyl transferase family protein [Amylibacter sp.]